MDDRNTIANTVTIRNGRFVAVGGRAPASAPEHHGDRSQGPHRRARTRRAAHPQREPRESSRLSHDPREHDVDPRDSGSAGRAPEERAGRTVDHVDGRLASESVEGASSSDPAGARRGRARSAGPAVRALHRSRGDEQRRQTILRRRRCRGAGSSGHQEDQRRRERRDCRRWLCRRRTVGERVVSHAPDADVRRQEAQHDRRDGVFGQRRADRAPRSGAVSDAGTAASESDSVEPRSVPDVRPVAGAAPGRQDDRPAADELSAEPERPGAAGAEGAPAQSVSVFRRRHADDRLDRRVGGAARERRRLARGAAARRAGRLAQREQRAGSGRAHAGGRGVRGGQQGIRHHAGTAGSSITCRSSPPIC